eukprot:scaffold16_cov242-Pinguiococcus_pyrenoidosus.AAC.3
MLRKHAKVSAESKSDGLMAPGQILTHYAPDVSTFLVLAAGGSDGEQSAADLPDAVSLSSAIVLDLGGRLEALKEKALYYRDLADPIPDVARGESDKMADAEEWTPCRRAASRLFEALRETESIEGKFQVFPFPPRWSRGSSRVTGSRTFLCTGGTCVLMPLLSVDPSTGEGEAGGDEYRYVFQLSRFMDVSVSASSAPAWMLDISRAFLSVFFRFCLCLYFCFCVCVFFKWLAASQTHRFGVADRMFRAASGKQISYEVVEAQLRSAG